MGLIDRINGLWPSPPAERSTDLALSFTDWTNIVSSFQFGNVNYTLPGSQQEDIGSSYSAIARGGYKGNGVVFACMANRVDLFSEARFMFQRMRGGRPGDLFTFRDSDLGLLETPWEGGTTGDLLSDMLTHVDIAGNAYVVRRAGGLTPLRPDWVTIIGGVKGDAEASVWHPDARVLGYGYQEGGSALGKKPVFFLPEEVAHFAPRRDPEARFRGMSWLTPVVRQVMADKAMDDHKLAFFENGATPNLAVTLNVDSLEKFRDWVKEVKGNHEGVQNAYKTLFLAAGASAEVLGVDMQQLDFKIVQGAGETRIAAAAGVPPVIVGLSEGLAAATYSNYSQARRRFADQTMRPLWRNVCGSLANILRVPSDGRLWYDDRDIKALQEDQKDAAEINQIDASSVVALVNGGFTAESAVAAIAARDLTLLEHTDLVSVQLQSPGTTTPSETPAIPPPAAAKRDDPLDMLEDELMQMLLERDRQQSINVNVQTPDVQVDVHPAAVTVEQPAHNVTVEPQRWEEGAIQVHVDAAPAPDVHVDVAPAAVTVESPRFEPGSIAVNVEAAPTPDVNVTVEAPQVTLEAARAPDVTVEAPQITVEQPDIHIQMPDRPVKRTIEFSDGRTASIEEEPLA